MVNQTEPGDSFIHSMKQTKKKFLKIQNQEAYLLYILRYTLPKYLSTSHCSFLIQLFYSFVLSVVTLENLNFSSFGLQDTQITVAWVNFNVHKYG